MPNRMSFQTQQFLTLLALAVVPLIIILGTSLPITRARVFSRTEDELSIVADLKTTQIDTWFHSTLSTGRLIAAQISDDIQMHLDESKNLEEILATQNVHFPDSLPSYVDSSSEIEAISLLHPFTGQVVISTDPTFIGRRRNNESYFQLGQQAPYINPVSYSVGRETPSSTVALPVFDNQEQLLAVLALELNLSDLEANLQKSSAGLGKTGRSYLIEAHGFYASQSDDDAHQTGSIAESYAVNQILQGKSGTDFYKDPQGVQVLGVYRWLPNYGLGLLVEIDQAELIGEYQASWIISIVLAGVLLFAFIILIHRISRRIVAPFIQISQVAKALKDGDLSRRTQPKGPQEIYELSSAFNDMADSLEKSYSQLEAQVQQRTREFVSVNQNLEDEIVQRKVIEDDLRKSEANLQEAQKIAKLGNFTVDLETEIITWSDEVYRIFDIPIGTIMTRQSFRKMLLPSDVERLQKATDNTIRTGEPYKFEYQVTIGNNQVKYLSTLGRLVTDEAGKPIEIFGVVQDITERKQTETILQQSEANLQEAQEIAKLGNFTVDLETEIITWSDEIYRIFDMPIGTPITRQSFRKLLHPDDVKRLQEATDKTLQVGEPYKFDYQVTLANNQVKHLSTLGRVIKDEAGKPIKIFGIAQDVTERKQTETILQQSEANLRQAQQIAKLGNFTVDLDTNEISWSDEIYRIFDMPIGSEIDQAQIQKMFSDADHERLMQAVENTIQTGTPYELEHSITLPDNSQKIVYILGSLVKDQIGQPVRIFGIMQDITERKRIETSLRESEASLQQAQQLAKIGSFEQDVRTQDLTWSDELYRIFELPIGSEISVEKFRERVPPDDVERINKGIENAINTGVSYEMEHQILLPEDRVKQAYVIGRPVRDEAGEIIKIFGVVQDITERKQFEEALRENEANLQEAQKIARLGNFTVDLETETITWSDEVYRIFDIPVGTPVNRQSFRKMMPPSDVKRMEEETNNTIRTGEPYKFEYQATLPNNQVKHLLTLGRLITNEAGRPIEIFGVVQDITEQKQIEEALRESEANLQQAQKVAKLGNFTFDLQTQSVSWSDEAYRIFEQPIGSEITLEKYQSLLLPSDFDRVMQAVENTVNTGEPYHIKHQLILPSGNQRYVQSIGRLITDETGQPIRIFGTVQDITELILFESALRESEANLQEAQKIAKLGNFTFELDTQAVTWSDEVYYIFEQPLGSEITLEKYQSLLPTSDFMRVMQEVEKTIETGDPYELEHLIQLPGKGEKFVFAIGRLIRDKSGAPIKIFGTIQDITERKLAEAALLESEARHRALFEQSPYGIMLHDAISGELIMANQMSAKMFGRHVEELLGTSPSFSSNDPEDSLRRWKRVLETGEKEIYERSFTVGDGKIRYAEITATPIKDSSGSVTLILAQLQDITDRKDLEKALEVSREHYRIVSELISNHAFSQRYVEETDQWVSDWGMGSTARLLGYSEEEFGGIVSVLHPEDHDRAVAGWEAVQQGVDNEGEYRVIAKNGDVHWLHIKRKAILDPNGQNVVRFYGVTQDITQRKRAEEVLRHSEQQLRRFAEAIPDRAVVLDKNGVYLRVLETHANHQYSGRIAVEGDTLQDVYTPEFTAFCLARIQQVLQTQENQSIEYHHTIEGKTYYFEARLVPYQDSQMSELGVLWIARSVTAHKEAEAAIQAALNEKETLLKEIHHRVKNNMQIISSLLRMQAMRIRDDELAYLFRESESRVHSMALIHEQLYQTTDFAKVDFKEYCQQLIQHITNMQRVTKDIQINLDHIEPVTLTLETAIPCGLIINEVITNAFKHAFPRDYEHGQISVRLHPTATEYNLTIQDNGIGLPDNFGAPETQTLGVRLIQTLVNQIDGQVKFHTDNGARVDVTFPKNPTEFLN